MSSLNRSTLMLDRALALILVKYPARTGLGVALGSTIGLLVHLFEPSLKALTAINLAAVPWWGWLPPGVLVMHLPTILSVFKQQSIGNDDVDLVLSLIERANFTATERRLQYRLLIERVRGGIQLQRSVGEHEQKTDRIQKSA